MILTETTKLIGQILWFSLLKMFVWKFKVVYARENPYMCGKLDMCTCIPEVWEYQSKKEICAEFIQNWIRILGVLPRYWKLIC